MNDVERGTSKGLDAGVPFFLLFFDSSFLQINGGKVAVDKRVVDLVSQWCLCFTGRWEMTKTQLQQETEAGFPEMSTIQSLSREQNKQWRGEGRVTQGHGDKEQVEGATTQGEEGE